MMRPTFEDTVRAFTRDPIAFFKLLRGLPKMVRLFWRLFRDKRTTWKARLVLLATLVYVISPVDLLPAMVFNVVGLLDDLTVLVFGCQWFLRLVPMHVVEEHMTALGADDTVSHA